MTAVARAPTRPRQRRPGSRSRPTESDRERVVEPFSEVDRARLLDEPALFVVDPVARERAGADELVAGRSVGVDGQPERGPGDRRPELDEGLVRYRARCREAHPAADGLDEPGRAVADL